MNRAHLGDALDHWKGSVIEFIGEKELRVVPMITDRDKWTPEDFDTYARLLHRNTDEILKQGKDDLFSNRTRSSYFCGLGEHDLFLDPDTGVASSEKPEKEHISPSEIAGLLPGSSSRLLLIYQHASRKVDGIKAKLKLLRNDNGLKGCGMFAYHSGTVSMVVICRNGERIAKILDRFKCWLGSVAHARIIV